MYRLTLTRGPPLSDTPRHRSTVDTRHVTVGLVSFLYLFVEPKNFLFCVRYWDRTTVTIVIETNVHIRISNVNRGILRRI